MKKIAYFLDTRAGFVLAYEGSCEFFVRFVARTGEWEDMGISFSEFRHDYEFKEISADEAMQKANGRLPESEYKQYCDIIRRNLGDI